MKLFYIVTIIVIAAILLVKSSFFTNEINLQIHPNIFINNIAKHQIFALGLALLVTIFVIFINTDSKLFLKKGNLDAIATKEQWLGINGKSTWKTNALQLMFVISFATGFFMFAAVKYTNSLENFKWDFVPLILLFSLTNSLSEELIFRFGIVGGLLNDYPKILILLLSALSFGIPHYLGWPSGFIGVIMSSLLGYILCKSTIETYGLAIAWSIHFLQDVIIFTAILMMNVKPN